MYMYIYIYIYIYIQPPKRFLSVSCKRYSLLGYAAGAWPRRELRTIRARRADAAGYSAEGGAVDRGCSGLG